MSHGIVFDGRWPSTKSIILAGASKHPARAEYQKKARTAKNRETEMAQDLKSAADAVLRRVVSGQPSVPGVVAMATDRRGNTYEGAAGKRMTGEGADMTTDSVFAIFSTSKAITGTAVLQLVEDGKLDLDAPAKTYALDIGRTQVLEGFDEAGKPRLRAPKRDVTTRMLLLHTAGFGYDFFNEH
jgi:methyl acetate hydrolase